MDGRSTWHSGLKSLVGAGFVTFFYASLLLFGGSLSAIAQESAGQASSTAAPSARDGSVPFGEYVTLEGWGWLVVSRGESGERSFGIRSSGGNGHSCGIDGEIVGTVAKVPTDSAAGVCEVRFFPKQNGSIEVKQAEGAWQACGYFCGQRAGIEGNYLIPARGCAPSAIWDTRKKFKLAYDSRDYGQAHKLLAPLLTRCAKTLYWYERYQIINDLAVTLFHLGRKSDCRGVLKPLVELAQTPDDSIEAPPIEADLLRPFARAARTNLKLCGYRVKMKDAE